MKTFAFVNGMLALAALAAPHTAHAERKRGALEEAPAVRHRKLLVRGRFELAPHFESTINADYRHTFGVGAKLEYHLSDMWSVGALGSYGLHFNTALYDRIVPTLTGDGVEPTQDEFTQRLNKIPLHGAAYVGFTPWYGKMAAFSSAFVNFDFYFQAGLAFASLSSDCQASVCNDPAPGQPRDSDGDGVLDDPDFDPANDAPLNNGSRFGVYLGGGIHVFLTDAIALDLTVRDYAFSDNPSGADFNGDLFVSDADSRFLHHLFMGAGVSIMLPLKAKRTN